MTDFWSSSPVYVYCPSLLSSSMICSMISAYCGSNCVPMPLMSSSLVAFSERLERKYRTDAAHEQHYVELVFSSTRSEAPTSSLDWSERRRQQTPGASAPESVGRGLLPATDDRKWNPPPTSLRRGTSGVCYQFHRITSRSRVIRDQLIAASNPSSSTNLPNSSISS